MAFLCELRSDRAVGSSLLQHTPLSAATKQPLIADFLFLTGRAILVERPTRILSVGASLYRREGVPTIFSVP
jgi:hypothetical protein